MPVRHLSVSSLQRFWRCPEDWRHYYIPGHREPATGAMGLDSAVGAALAHDFAGRLDGAPLNGGLRSPLCHHAFELAAADALRRRR